MREWIPSSFSIVFSCFSSCCRSNPPGNPLKGPFCSPLWSSSVGCHGGDLAQLHVHLPTFQPWIFSKCDYISFQASIFSRYTNNYISFQVVNDWFWGVNVEGNVEVRTVILRRETCMSIFFVGMKMAYICVSRIGTKRHAWLESHWNWDSDGCCNDLQNDNRWWMYLILVVCLLSSLKRGSFAHVCTLKASLTLPGPRLVMWGQAGSLL